MAGDIVPMPANGAVDWSNFVVQVEKQRTGYMGLSLTNFDNALEPEIAAGSICEINGSVAKFDINEAITGWGVIGNDNDVYIKLVPAALLVTAEFTLVAPTWSDAKQGWYGAGGSATHRYVGGLYKDAGGDYTAKYLYLFPIREDSIRNENIRDDAVDHDKINFNVGGNGDGTQLIAIGGTWTPAEGIWNVVQIGGAGDLQLEIYVSGAWRRQINQVTLNFNWMIITDGTNVRLVETAGATATIYFHRLQ